MNIHYPQVEKKSQSVSILLAAFAVFTALMLTVSLSRHAGLNWSVPSTSRHLVQSVESNSPVAIPAPQPPAEQTQAMASPERAPDPHSILVPQLIAAPQPSVP